MNKKRPSLATPRSRMQNIPPAQMLGPQPTFRQIPQNMIQRRDAPAEQLSEQLTPRHPNRLSGLMRDIEDVSKNKADEDDQELSDADTDTIIMVPSASDRSLIATIGSLQQSNADLEFKLRELAEDKRTALERKDIEMQKLVREFHDSVADIRADNEALKKQLKHTSMESSRAHEAGDAIHEISTFKIEMLTDQVDILAQERQELTDIQFDLLQRQRELGDEKSELSQTIESMHKDLSTKSVQIADLDRMVTKLKSVNEDLETAVRPNFEALRKTWDEENRERITIKIRNEFSKQLMPDYDGELPTDTQKLRDEIHDRLRSKVNSELVVAHNTQLKEQQSANDELQKDVDEMELLLTEAQAEMDRTFAGQKETSIKKLSEMQLKMFDMETEREQMIAKAAELEKNHAELQIKFKAMESALENSKVESRSTTLRTQSLVIINLKPSINIQIPPAESQSLQSNLKTLVRKRSDAQIADTVTVLSSQHRLEVEKLNKEKSELTEKLAKLANVQVTNENLQKRSADLEVSITSLQKQIVEKDKVIYDIKKQFQRRLSSSEAALRDRLGAIATLTHENQALTDNQKGTFTIDRSFSTPNTRRPTITEEEREVASLHQQVKSLENERSELMSMQHSLLQRQLEQVADRERLEYEIDDLNSRINEWNASSNSVNSVASKTDLETPPRRNWLRRLSATDKGLSKESSTAEDKKYRKHLQKTIVHYSKMEAEWKHRNGELQKSLTQAMVDLDTALQENEKHKIVAARTEEIVTLRFVKQLTLKDEKLEAKDVELKHLKKLHHHYGKSRRLFRANTQPTVLEEPEITEERTFIRPRSQSVPNAFDKKQQQERSRSVGESLSNVPEHRSIHLPKDVPTLQSHIHKLLDTVAYLRHGILRAQQEIETHRSEAMSLKDELLHVKDVLAKDRDSAHSSISEWELWASEVQTQHSSYISMRDDEVEQLRSRLESAKQEWEQMVDNRDVIIRKLVADKKAVTQELFEECAVRLNRMQHLMESGMQQEKETLDKIAR